MSSALWQEIERVVWRVVERAQAPVGVRLSRQVIVGEATALLHQLANGRLDLAENLRRAAHMVHEIRPANWADDEDPDQVAAWSALEEALLACRVISS